MRPKRSIPDVGQTLYRFRAILVWGNRIDVAREEWVVRRHTPSGYWLEDKWGGKTWRCVNNKFAWPTEEEARASLVARSRSRYLIAYRKLRDAERILRHLGEPLPDGELTELRMYDE